MAFTRSVQQKLSVGADYAGKANLDWGRHPKDKWTFHAAEGEAKAYYDTLVPCPQIVTEEAKTVGGPPSTKDAVREDCIHLVDALAKAGWLFPDIAYAMNNGVRLANGDQFKPKAKSDKATASAQRAEAVQAAFVEYAMATAEDPGLAVGLRTVRTKGSAAMDAYLLAWHAADADGRAKLVEETGNT